MICEGTPIQCIDTLVQSSIHCFMICEGTPRATSPDESLKQCIGDFPNPAVATKPVLGCALFKVGFDGRLALATTEWHLDVLLKARHACFGITACGKHILSACMHKGLATITLVVSLLDGLCGWIAGSTSGMSHRTPPTGGAPRAPPDILPFQVFRQGRRAQNLGRNSGSSPRRALNEQRD
jgi:hypothetical protein